MPLDFERPQFESLGPPTQSQVPGKSLAPMVSALGGRPFLY